MNRTQFQRPLAAVRVESEAQGSIPSSPIRALSLALGVTALALAFLAWNAFRTIKQIEDLERRDLRIEQLRGKIVYLDEVLTMSAHMAAETGDPQWEARYRKFEPELTIVIQEALSLSPKTVAVEFVARTDAANSALVQMENRAFELIHQRQLEAARATLFSGEYDRQKRIYAAGMIDLDSALKQSVRRGVEGEIRRGQIVLVISTMALPLLLSCWIIALRTMNRWKAALMRHDKQLSRQAAELAQLNADLDRRVAERTSELERSREEALHHLEESQQAHEEIARLAHKFELILNCAGEGIFSLDLEGKTTGLNPSAARMLGWEADELKARVMHSVIHHTKADGSPYPQEECPVHSAFLQGTIHRIENEVFWRKDGTSFPVEYTSAPICRGDGQPEGVVVIFRDVTKRMRAERQIFLQAAALESAANAIVIADCDGLITWVNPSFTRLTGFSAEEAIGQNPRILKSGLHDEAFYQQMWQTLASRRVWRGEIINKRKDGTLYHEDMTITSVCSDGKILHFIAIKQDISERIRSQKELAAAREAAESANRAKSDFLARMSHEIRTPLNGVIGMTELALDTKLDPEQREYLETVRKSGDALLAVINDILDFSKIEAQKLELESVPFRLRDTLDDMVTTLAVRAQQKGLELACDVSADVPDVLVGDPGRLRQILMNLVGNAIKFTRIGEVVVRVALQSESETTARLLFSVRDTGAGIPPEKLESIFQPFEQADGTITRRYGGTGLGLAIATQLSGLMGGTLSVESKPGEGSTFLFTAELQIGDLAEAPTHVNLHALPALVVDDNETNRRILEKVLGSWSIHVTTADGGTAALTAIQWAASAQNPFRLALVDSQMPVLDGFALIGELRKNPNTASLPVIMMTSAGQPGDAARCRELGVAAYLTKPVRQSQLLETINAVLGIPETEAVPQPLITRHSLRAQKRSLHILLAEDNLVNQMVAQRVLEKWGHAVRTVNNGKEALEALKSQAFDLVLMDIEMPEMDGLQTTAVVRLREQGTSQHVPIVAMTAHAMKGDKERCLAAGMDAYVSKPVQVNELYEVLEDLMSQRQPEAAARREVQPDAQDPAFDRARALQFVSGSEQLLSEIAAVFLEHTPQILKEIHTAIATRDAKSLERAAHTLKGSVSVFGADAAGAAAQELEALGRAGAVEGAEIFCATLEAEVAQLRIALAELTHVSPARRPAEAAPG